MRKKCMFYCCHQKQDSFPLNVRQGNQTRKGSQSKGTNKIAIMTYDIIEYVNEIQKNKHQ